MLCRYGSRLRLEISILGNLFASLDMIKLIMDMLMELVWSTTFNVVPLISSLKRIRF